MSYTPSENPMQNWQEGITDQDHRILFQVHYEIAMEDGIKVIPMQVAWECNHGEIGIFTGEVADALIFVDLRNRLQQPIMLPLKYAEQIRLHVDANCPTWKARHG